jgi:hypothetical protein
MPPQDHSCGHAIFTADTHAGFPQQGPAVEDPKGTALTTRPDTHDGGVPESSPGHSQEEIHDASPQRNINQDGILQTCRHGVD